MALIDFQTALGELVRGGADSSHLECDQRDRQFLDRLISTAGFRLTRSIQQSWCAGRAARAAHLTLSLLPLDQRQRLLDEWLAHGGGSASFFALEAEAFLDFIARQLPDPSHELTVCRMEQGVFRASRGASAFVAQQPRELEAQSVLRRGQYASLVEFHAEPSTVLATREPGAFPPVGPRVTSMLFAPGLTGLVRSVTDAEVALWQTLDESVSVDWLWAAGYDARTIADFVATGAAELVGN